MFVNVNNDLKRQLKYSGTYIFSKILDFIRSIIIGRKLYHEKQYHSVHLLYSPAARINEETYRLVSEYSKI